MDPSPQYLGVNVTGTPDPKPADDPGNDGNQPLVEPVPDDGTTEAEDDEDAA